MTKKIQLMMLLFTLVFLKSWGRVTEFRKLDAYKNVQPDFYASIPDELPDSLKAARLIDLVNSIEADTTLKVKRFSDTSGMPVYAYYRNKSLVKIYTGTFYEDEFYHAVNYSYTKYFFHSDTFICMNYECSHNLTTGSCSPVSASSKYYFASDSILFEKHDRVVPHPYWTCGCMGPYFFPYWALKVDFQEAIINEVSRLKTLINSQ